MSSSVFFKFKSWKEPQRITFDGTGISVFELKREIINVSGLGDGTDFDLSISNEDNTEQYDDDTTIIPRSTTVIAHRSPAARPGYGKAARYVSGKMPVTAKNTHRAETSASKPATQGKGPEVVGGAQLSEAQSEEERIAAMFKASGDQWEQQKQQMANAKPAHRTFKPKQDVPERPLPPNYICYRCHQQGHWIYNCPTNNDPSYDNRPRVKRTTGIPKAFLKTVEKPVAFNSDGLTDDSKQSSGVMMTAEGEYVIAQPDKASWDLYQAKAKAAQEQQKAAASGSQELRDRGLECPIDKRMFVDPVKTPCCGKTYCNDCIENALVNSDLVCPNCSTEGVLIDDLVPDEETIKRIREFEEEKAKERKEKEASKSPKSEPAKPAQAVDAESKDAKEKSKSPPPNEASNSAANSPTAAGTNSSAEDMNSKKRPAEEDLDNDRVPTAPAAMRKQQEAEKAVQDTDTKAMDPTQNFIQQMNALGNLQPGTQSMPMPFNGAGMTNPMGMMNPNMGMPMMPMGGMGMQMGMGPGIGMPMSMPGMMGMQNPMMNPMMNPGWNNFNNMNSMGGGFPQQHNMYNNNYMNGPQNMNGYGQNHNQGPSNWPGQQPPGGNEEDNAYFRKPVNPHRHHNRSRRAARPTDYTEL